MTMMTIKPIIRREDWPERLAQAVEKASAKSFGWGRHDCAMLAANVVRAMTGTDIAKGFRGKYRTLAGAEEFIEKYGESVFDVVEKTLCEKGLVEEINPLSLARRGDMIGCISENGPALGICLGDVACFPGKKGVVYYPPEKWAKAWKIG